ncbi:hypothetical protein ACCO45_004818 [Purpureocillium lilacinum]|uniref:Uncharacterized protein n=1 Tax=Purpureocillium lilacinum TaxID=33203 RepID=A0ACC4DTN0_PURLI
MVLHSSKPPPRHDAHQQPECRLVATRHGWAAVALAPPRSRAGQASGARLFATSGENTLGNPPSAICNSAATTTIKSSPPRGNPAVWPLGPLLKASLACWIRRMAQSNSDRRSVLRRASSARGSRDWLSGYVQIARSEPGSGGQRALASLGASCLCLARAWDKVST